MNNNCIILLLILVFIFLIYKKSKASMTNGFFFKYIFELDDKGKMKIYDECKFDAIGTGGDKEWEIGECSIAIQIIPYVNNVLEIGGGAGKVSHMINKKLQEKGIERKHVVVEPGPTSSKHFGNDSIQQNKNKFGDQYTIVRKLAEKLDMNDLTKLGEPPDCLYVDCEGCLKKFHQTDLGKYVLSNVRFIVNEMDGHNEELRNTWKQYGFTKIGVGYGCGTKCDTEVWYKERLLNKNIHISR